MSEVTVGGDDVLLSGVSTKKRSQDQIPIEKEKRKGMLSGEAYSRAVDRSVKHNNVLSYFILVFENENDNTTFIN